MYYCIAALELEAEIWIVKISTLMEVKYIQHKVKFFFWNKQGKYLWYQGCFGWSSKTPLVLFLVQWLLYGGADFRYYKFWKKMEPKYVWYWLELNFDFNGRMELWYKQKWHVRKSLVTYATQLARGLLLKMLRYCEVMLKTFFKFSHVKEIVKYCLVYKNKFS